MSKEPKHEFESPRPEAVEGESVAVPYLEQSDASGAAGAIVQRHTDQLLAIEGVVMVGQGQDEIGRDCIMVGLKTAQQLSKIPKEIEGLPVRATVIGEVDALKQAKRGGGAARKR